jgi:hypothetical protein
MYQNEATITSFEGKGLPIFGTQVGFWPIFNRSNSFDSLNSSFEIYQLGDRLSFGTENA